MSAPNAEAWQALVDRMERLQRELLAAVGQPLHTSTGGIDTAQVLQQLAAAYARDPQRWQQLQDDWYREQMALWQAAAAGTPPDTTTTDRRFRAPQWRQPYFAWLSQSYVATARWLTAIASHAPLDAAAKRKTEFLMRQWVDAACPANFGWGNPEALQLAAQTQGASVAQGLRHLQDDLAKGMVSMTDERAFEVGRNLAVTPGAVVFENELMQLIQYRPLTDAVHERPLLMVPPCINKFYILDLQPENSLARYAVEQGHTVFMVSWRNVPTAMGRVSWDDYVQNGLITAIDVARKICGVRKINALGFCVGGTLLATALAVLRARRD